MVTDFAAYVIPGQEACTGFDDARAQLHMALDAGVQRLVAVAPFDIGDEPYKMFRRRMQPGVEFLLRRDFKYAPEDIRIAAVAVARKELLELEELEALCISGTKTLLLELPLARKNPEITELPEKLRRLRGVNPVIIHAESGRVAEEFFARGIPCCFNAGAFVSIFSGKKMLALAEKGAVAAVASEIKGLRDGYADFKRAAAALAPYMDSINNSMNELLK
ncbi:MAG: hypothetical protein IJP23_06045 [Oscillospiraceae bacterium]|nr:hypothetical protein [Oscillospiraceae bacterium]